MVQIESRDQSQPAMTGALAESRASSEIWRAPRHYRFLLRLLRWLFARLFRIEVRGRENIPPGSYLLVANHLNWSDPFVLLTILPDEPRVYFIGKQEEVFKTWWRRAILDWVGGVIPVSQTSHRSHQDLVTRTAATLAAGAVVGILPEGATSPEVGKLLPVMTGVGYLAIRSEVPMLRIALAGTSDLYLGRRITVTIAPPLAAATEPRALKHRAEATVEQVRAALEAMVAPYEEPAGVVKRWRWLTRLM